ncbi:MAG: sigma-70 family RNA polymerase sigma factor [Actinobacteria bacterium]|nr:sigma-70 family RNA polymerase sigma factor [Actinomycetota bacterium]
MAQGQSPHLGEMGEISSEELACRTQAGSSACFEELVNRYEGRLLNFLVRRTRYIEEAEDLLQDTFARAYHKIKQYNPKWRFSTWLFTIAGRLAYNQRRRPHKQSLDEAQLPWAKEHNPLTIVARQEEKENLWALAEELLSQKQFTALWFRYVEGMSIKEIARVMGKTQNYIKVVLFRSRSLLAKKLKGRGMAGRSASPNRPDIEVPSVRERLGGK